MNFRMFAARHWKAIVIALSICLVVLALNAGKVHADPIDTPWGP